jgi:hypothetical protein
MATDMLVQLDKLRDIILHRQHPTVWREMQHQHARHPELRPLFAALPDAAKW